MTHVRSYEIEQDSPLDMLEYVAMSNNWAFHRLSDHELTLQMQGRWFDYTFYIAWQETAAAMHLTLSLETRVPPEKRPQVYELLALINDKIWIGHFAIWEEESLLSYRNALPLRGTVGPTEEQVEDLIENAISESERFYPALQYVIWGGQPASEALAAAMIDPVGEA